MPYSKEEYAICLQGLLSDDSDLRRESAEDLGYSGIEEASLELVKHLADPDKGVRDAVANSLKKLDYAPSAFALTEYLKNQQIDIRNYASDILVSMQQKAIPALIKILGEPDHDVRKFAADILGSIKSRDSIPVLTRHLDDPDLNVQVSAIEALGNLGYPDTVDILMEKAHRSPENMAMVLDALGKIGGDRISFFLESALNDEDAITVFSAIETMGNVGDSKFIPLLLGQLTTREDYFSAPSLIAILKILKREKKPVSALEGLYDIPAEVLTAAFSEDEAVELFSDNVLNIDSGHFSTRFYLCFLPYLNKEAKINLISRVSLDFNKESLSLISKLLEDQDGWIVYKTCSLADTHDLSSLADNFLQLAISSNEMVVIGAVKALSKLKIQKALPVLENLLSAAADVDLQKEISAAIEAINRK